LVWNEEEDNSDGSINNMDTKSEVRQLFSQELLPGSSTQNRNKGANASGTVAFDSLRYYNVTKKQMKCQICAYKMRGYHRERHVLVDQVHKVRVCRVKRPPQHLDDMAKPLIMNGTGTPVSDSSCILGDESNLTCMEKFHIYYLPKKLFSNTGGDIIKNNKVKLRTSESLRYSLQKPRQEKRDCSKQNRKYSKEYICIYICVCVKLKLYESTTWKKRTT
jgi:hypothetical protein